MSILPILGCSFSPIVPGAPILAVTSPLLVLSLLRDTFAGGSAVWPVIRPRITAILDAAHANPVHGVLQAETVETVDSPVAGLHAARLLCYTTDTLLVTDEAVKQALGEPVGHAGGPAFPADLNNRDFEAAHPWFRFVGLDLSNGTALARSQSGDPLPAETFALVFPNDAGHRLFLREHFHHQLTCINADRSERLAAYNARV